MTLCRFGKSTLISSTTTVEERFSYPVKDTSITLILNKTNDRVTGAYFIDTEDNNLSAKYYYTTDRFHEILLSSPTFLLEAKDRNQMFIKTSDYLELIKTGIDLEKLAYIDSGSNLPFKYGQKAPIPHIVVLDYIGGIKSSTHDVQGAYKHLQKHPAVLDLKVNQIPGYNCSIPQEKGLYIKFIPSQEYLTKAWDFLLPKERHPSLNLRDSYIPQTYRDWDLDFLGLKPFLLPEN